MSIQDDAFDISHVFDKNGKVSKEDVKIGKKAWEDFRAWAWGLEEQYDKIKKQNDILRGAIAIKLADDEKDDLKKKLLEYVDKNF